MARQSSKKGKGLYAEYKADNRAQKNKVKKLERHCKKFPEDTLAASNLARIKKEGYIARSKPLVPGSNPTKAKVTTGYKINQLLYSSETAGEQLSRLLGIPMLKPRPKVKTIIKHKPRRK